MHGFDPETAEVIGDRLPPIGLTSVSETLGFTQTQPINFYPRTTMAKPVTQKIKLVSSAGTGYFYVTKKTPRNQTEKMVFKKYDPVARKHVEFKESKIK